MIELYIKDKIEGYMQHNESARRINLIEKNALIASIMNDMTREIDMAMHEATVRIFDKLHKVVRDKL